MNMIKIHCMHTCSFQRMNIILTFEIHSSKRVIFWSCFGMTVQRISKAKNDFSKLCFVKRFLTMKKNLHY